MNLRERFLEVMSDFRTNIRSIKWEFGYWGKTINNWYQQGLPKKNPAPIPSEFTTPGASLYMAAWNSPNKYRYKNGIEGFPNGIGIWGGALYWPSQGFPLDRDVKDYFNMDQSQRGVTGMYPFEVECGIDIVKVRKKFPKLQMMGGIPKFDISLGKKRIDKILKPLKEVLKTGGYVPFGDHLIPPEVLWNDFKYYRDELNSIIEKFGK